MHKLEEVAAGVELYAPSGRYDVDQDHQRELNEAIAAAIGMPLTVKVGNPILGNERMVPRRLPDFIASLDAAVSLVPEGWRWFAGHREHPHARAYVENGQLAFIGVGTCRNPDRIWCEVTAATPALALCAAALRAIAQRETDCDG